jgi:hypothetical protein
MDNSTNQLEKTIFQPLLYTKIYNVSEVDQEKPKPKPKNLKPQYSLDGMDVIFLDDPSDASFSTIYSNSNQLMIQDPNQYIYTNKYKYTPESDEYNKYIHGVTALNDEIKNKYKNENIIENVQYCNYTGSKKINLLSNNNYSKRLDSLIKTDNALWV